MKESDSTSLNRGLGLRDSLAIVAGSMIGTGIFLKTATMTQLLGSPFWVLLAWAAAGVLSFLGAMTYAELGARFPEAGGGYVFLREAYGRLLAFISGWVSFWIILPGSIAAFAVASSTFLNGVLPGLQSGLMISVGLIVVFAAINCLAITFGGRIQSLLTGLKVLIIVILIGAIFIFTPEPQNITFDEINSIAWGPFGIATLAALWAFDGWESIARMAGEVRQPHRNIPLSLFFGILIVFGLYIMLNLAYFWALPLGEIAASNSTLHPQAYPVATKAILSFSGDWGVKILSAVFVISTLGAMNGSIMTSARIPFAMAKDGLLFSFLSKVSPHTRVPVRAVWVQALVAALLAATGTFDQLTNYVVFSAWVFYGLTGLTVFVFRKSHRGSSQAFRVPGYPWVPGLFVLMAATLVVTTFIQSPVESGIGLALMLTGVPVYYLLYRKTNKAES